LLYNLDDSPFAGGQYHGKILIPQDYPLKPPAIVFITPQGRFKCGEKICLYFVNILNLSSFTNYHPETWSTSWTIGSMLVGLISFMHTQESTLGGVATSDHQKRVHASQSIAFNNHNPIFIEQFKDHMEYL
jgi:ubiquitin-conjugating enzyme E2 J2